MNYTKTINSLITEVSKGFLGNKTLVEDAILSLTSGLHILIEDVSGVGKTTLCKCISKAAGLDISRIQFTPDMLPGDITGMNIWDNNKREFIFKKGPIFSEFIMGDEINRASARTQSALLEAMEEKTVSIDGVKYTLPDFFTVIATKNPDNYLGTFELPESQLDRFGILLKPGYPSQGVEVDILSNFKSSDPVDKIEPVTNSTELLKILDKVKEVEIDKSILNYIVEIGNKTRINDELKTGFSTRGLKHLLSFSQAKAFLSNRDYVIPEDVIYSIYRVGPHKLELSHDASINNIDIKTVIKAIIDKINIPVKI